MKLSKLLITFSLVRYKMVNIVFRANVLMNSDQSAIALRMGHCSRKSYAFFNKVCQTVEDFAIYTSLEYYFHHSSHLYYTFSFRIIIMSMQIMCYINISEDRLFYSLLPNSITWDHHKIKLADLDQNWLFWLREWHLAKPNWLPIPLLLSVKCKPFF